MTATLFATPVARVVNEPTTSVSNAGMPVPYARGKPQSGYDKEGSGDKNARLATVPEWELPEVTAQIAMHNERIVESETSVLDDYWLSGRLLERVRANFKRGTWLPWLNRRGIDHTRAKRARLLAQEFSSADELRGLSLHEALRISRQRKKGRNGRAETPLTKLFRSGLRALRKILGGLDGEEASHEHSAFAREFARMAADIVRSCPISNVALTTDADVAAAESVESSADAQQSATTGPCARRAVIDVLEGPARQPFAPTGSTPVERMIDRRASG